jgi:hypothetical protein
MLFVGKLALSLSASKPIKWFNVYPNQTNCTCTIVHNFQNIKSSPMFFEQSLQVAVIGDDIAGLLTARGLKREGHRVIVFVMICC